MCVCLYCVTYVFGISNELKEDGVFCGAIRSVALNCRQSLRVCVRVCAEALRSINLHADRDEQEEKLKDESNAIKGKEKERLKEEDSGERRVLF